MAGEQPKYNEDARYLVRVTRPVMVGPFKYLPRNEMRAKGSLLNQIVAEHGEDAIGTAERL